MGETWVLPSKSPQPRNERGITRESLSARKRVWHWYLLSVVLLIFDLYILSFVLEPP